MRINHYVHLLTTYLSMGKVKYLPKHDLITIE